jgi:hypothetical protein
MHTHYVWAYHGFFDETNANYELEHVAQEEDLDYAILIARNLVANENRPKTVERIIIGTLETGEIQFEWLKGLGVTFPMEGLYLNQFN